MRIVERLDGLLFGLKFWIMLPECRIIFNHAEVSEPQSYVYAETDCRARIFYQASFLDTMNPTTPQTTVYPIQHQHSIQISSKITSWASSSITDFYLVPKQF